MTALREGLVIKAKPPVMQRSHDLGDDFLEAEVGAIDQQGIGGDFEGGGLAGGVLPVTGEQGIGLPLSLAAVEARHREELARKESEELRLALARRRDEIERERADILQAAQRDAEDTVAQVRRELDQAKRDSVQRGYDAKIAEATLKALDTTVSKLTARARPQVAEVARILPTRDIGPGDRIHVRDIPQEGEALSTVGEDGRLEVQFGSIRMKVSVDRIDRVQSAPGREAKISLPAHDGPPVPIELDLRGQRAEEALLKFETYLDDAFRSGLPFVRIIHGKGTGALRAAVREALTGHPLVRKFESAQQNEGGEGVTIAVLAG